MALVGFCLPGLGTQHVRCGGPQSVLSRPFAGVAPRQLPSLGRRLPGPFLQVRSVSQVFSFHLSADSQSGNPALLPHTAAFSPHQGLSRSGPWTQRCLLSHLAGPAHYLPSARRGDVGC